LNLKNPKILILGIAYKPEVNDTRKSPTIEIINKLKANNFDNIFVHDPYTSEAFGATLVTKNLDFILKDFDCIITVTAHKQYKEIDVSVLKDNCIILDAARIFEKERFRDTNTKYLPLGSR
jgi:UDP-N-acetyl-D-mannosaminuronate dehydrogenase